MDHHDERSPFDDEHAIRARVDGLAQAIRAKDVELVLSAFAAEVVSFDLGPPLCHGGGDAFARRWREVFATFPGEIAYEVRDLRVAVEGGIAFTHSLNRVAGASAAGPSVDRWLRWTACWRKTAGRWQIVHEHVSVPVDVRQGRALLDETP